MRWCVALALIFTLLSPDAFAAGKGKRGKKKKDGPNMDTIGADPVSKEQSDGGPYTPKGKTGALAEKVEAKQEVEEVIKAKPRDKAVVFADALLGIGAAPKPGPASSGFNRTQDAKSFGLVIGGAIDLSPKFSLGLRVPWSTASIERGSSPGSDSSMTFGSPEIFGELRHPLAELWTLPILFGLGVPLAQGDPDPSGTDITAAAKAQTGLLVDASGGWKDGELYAPKRLPVILGIGVQHERKALEFHAYTKLIAGINLGTDIRDPKVYGTDPTGQLGEVTVKAVSLRDVTLVGIKYDLSRSFWVGADAWVVYNPLEPVQYESSATPPTKFQFVGEPRLGAVFGKVRPSVGFVYPIGGRLADSGIFGIRAHLDYAF
jgi:hypothetical protein